MDITRFVRPATLPARVQNEDYILSQRQCRSWPAIATTTVRNRACIRYLCFIRQSSRAAAPSERPSKSVEGCLSVGNFIRVPRRRSRTWEPESGQTPGTLVRLVRYRKVAVALWTDLDLPIFALSSVQWGSIEWALDGRLTELSDLTLIECRTSRSCRSRANHWFNNGASRPARSPCSELVLLLAKFPDPFRFFPVADLRQSVEFGVGVFSSGKRSYAVLSKALLTFSVFLAQ
jgi:hypothetical protein